MPLNNREYFYSSYHKEDGVRVLMHLVIFYPLVKLSTWSGTNNPRTNQNKEGNVMM